MKNSCRPGVATEAEGPARREAFAMTITVGTMRKPRGWVDPNGDAIGPLAKLDARDPRVRPIVHGKRLQAIAVRRQVNARGHALSLGRGVVAWRVGAPNVAHRFAGSEFKRIKQRCR